MTPEEKIDKLYEEIDELKSKNRSLNEELTNASRDYVELAKKHLALKAEIAPPRAYIFEKTVADNNGLSISYVSDVLDLYSVSGKRYTEKGLDIVMEGDYKGRHFIINRYGGHPNGYIEVKPTDYIFFGELDEELMDCRYDLYEGRIHGGMTYFGKINELNGDERVYIGWDYAHLGDHIEYSDKLQLPPVDTPKDKKWTLPEVLMDVARAWDGITDQNIRRCP